MKEPGVTGGSVMKEPEAATGIAINAVGIGVTLVGIVVGIVGIVVALM